VNAPPEFDGSPTISVNDAVFPFTTVLSSYAHDPEGAALTFAWFEGSTPVGGNVTTGPVLGVYHDVLTLVGVSANRTLTQVITDAGGGVTRIDYAVRGYAASGLSGGGSALSNSITSDLPEMIIGAGQTATFTVYARDTVDGQLSFEWELRASDGWSAAVAGAYPVTDTPAKLSNGSFKSQIVQSIAAETPGLRPAYCTVTNVVTGQEIVVKSVVQLISSLQPAIMSISTDAPVVDGSYKILRDGYVHFNGTATDQNNLLMNYRWDFTQPAITLWGRTVMIRPDQHSIFDASELGAGSKPILGSLTVLDKFGQATVGIDSYVTVQ
ncbi:MAG: hypothetical protein JZU63_07770, partial [Rhodoferax sp.]|nr:hypothetical protein [Rhodoferax sp.]